MRGVVLAIDYGLARVGLARCDPDQLVVTACGTLERQGDRRLADEILRYLREVDATEVVIGLPLRDDGGSTEVIEGARRLARHLRRRSGLPVAFVDESLSSQQADARASRLGLGRRRARQQRDALAAEEILRRFLDEGATEEFSA